MIGQAITSANQQINLNTDQLALKLLFIGQDCTSREPPIDGVDYSAFLS